MTESLPALTPASPQQPEIRLTPEHALGTRPATEQLSPDQMHTLDEAFKSPPDGALGPGLLMLWANTPFLVELAREHFHKDAAAEDDAKRELE